MSGLYAVDSRTDALPATVGGVRIAVVGSGYSGAQAARYMAERGHAVVAVGRRPEPLHALAAEIGRVEARVADVQQPAELQRALQGADRLLLLVPPPREGDPSAAAAAVLAALPRSVDRVVYGSTTGVYAPPEDPEVWVDEHAPVGPAGRLGRARRVYEESLLENASAPVHLVRIAGIYGPGRTLAERLRAGTFAGTEGARPTSRIHRDDLARLLVEVVLAEAPPPIVLACDEHPATTLEVARFTAVQLGLPPPPAVSAAEADRRSSPIAREFRAGGKRCRSLYRESLIGPLRFPSYREGVPASLEAETRAAAKT